MPGISAKCQDIGRKKIKVPFRVLDKKLLEARMNYARSNHLPEEEHFYLTRH